MAKVSESQSKEPPPVIEFGASKMTMAGHAECGDLSVVTTLEASALVAVVDGAGHGDGAALAAKIAVATIESQAQKGLIALVNLCHSELMRTRGAVMSLALFDDPKNTMTWLGVGNVEGLVLRALPGGHLESQFMLLRSGLVGYRLPPLRTTSVPINRGDLLILTTDGISTGYADGLVFGDPVQRIADRICSHYGKPTDDGLALVVRYLGCEV